MMGWLPENASLAGKEVDFLFYVIYYIPGATLLLVGICMAAFLIMYRKKPGVRATYTHGNNTLEIVWTVVPALILVLLVFMTSTSWSRIKVNVPANPDVTINVLGKQFNWIVNYSGPDGKFGTPDDKKVDNVVHVPVNKQVLINLEGKDVIHSFFVPHFRIKQDVVPGRDTRVWFTAIKPGTYPIPCAELCGFGHSGMQGKVVVHTPESYKKWLETTWPAKKSS